MSNKKEKVLDSDDFHRKANEKFISELSISDKEKMRAPPGCGSKDLHIFNLLGVRSVLNKLKREYIDEDYDEKRNKL